MSHIVSKRRNIQSSWRRAASSEFTSTEREGGSDCLKVRAPCVGGSPASPGPRELQVSASGWEQLAISWKQTIIQMQGEEEIRNKKKCPPNGTSKRRAEEASSSPGFSGKKPRRSSERRSDLPSAPCQPVSASPSLDQGTQGERNRGTSTPFEFLSPSLRVSEAPLRATDRSKRQSRLTPLRPLCAPDAAAAPRAKLRAQTERWQPGGRWAGSKLGMV